MAAAGVPMRTLQEWMGHRDFKATLIYADYAPSAHERTFIDHAFAQVDVAASRRTDSPTLRELAV
jgi:hypothetical protein